MNKSNNKYRYDIERVTDKMWKKKKSYKYLYTLACQKAVIKKAYFRMKRGKTKRAEIIAIESNLDNYIEKIQIMLINTKPKGWDVDRELSFRPKYHKCKIIRDSG